MLVFMVMLILPRYILPHHKFRMLSIVDFLKTQRLETARNGAPRWARGLEGRTVLAIQTGGNQKSGTASGGGAPHLVSRL